MAGDDDLAAADDGGEKHPDFTGADGNRYIWNGTRYELAPGLPRAQQKAQAKPKIKALKGYPRIGTDAEGNYYILDAVGGGVTEVDPQTGEVPRDLGMGKLQWREMTPEEYLQAEDAGVFDEDGPSGSGGGLTAYQSAQLARQQQQDQLALEQFAREEAKDAELLRFNRDKWAVEVEQGKTQEARLTQALGEQIQARLESNRIEREQLQQRQLENQQQIQLAQQSAAQRSREFEASFGQREREFAADEAARAEQQGLARAQEQRQRAETAGVLAANPGDVGRLAGFLTAGGLSPISTMLGQGQTAITDRSLEPLAALFAAEEAGRASGVAGAQLWAPPANPDDISAWRDPPGTTPGGRGSAMERYFNYLVQKRQAGAYENQPLERRRAIDALYAGPNQGAMPPPQGPIDLVDADPRSNLPYAEDGAAVGDLAGLIAMAKMMGMQPKAVAGEKGKANGETVWSNGDVVITPDKGKGLPRMQGGGLLASQDLRSQWGPNYDRLIALARQFLQRSGQTALDRSGFATPPSPIELSDPGTSGFTRQLGAATTAATRGVNPQAWYEELNRIIPMGQTFGLMRRSI